MPAYVKIVISLLALVAGGIVFSWQQNLGQAVPAYAAAIAGIVAVIGVWIFPEASAAKSVKRR